MTKYVLHGGSSSRDILNNKEFFREITANLADSATILVVCYAIEHRDWNTVIEADKKIFSRTIPDKDLKFLLADKEINTFLDQIRSADAIYIHGGNSHILKDYLDKIIDLESVWKDKVIAGSSAGALVLGKYFYENDDDTCNEGLGILPFKIFCHYFHLYLQIHH